jgi:hypothetical protein
MAKRMPLRNERSRSGSRGFLLMRIGYRELEWEYSAELRENQRRKPVASASRHAGAFPFQAHTVLTQP